MKRFKMHWIILSLYFVLGSLILLFTNTSHHVDPTLPYLLIVLPLLLLFWNPARKTSGLSLIAILVVVFFVILHIAPFVPLAQAHHQTSSSEQHPCCMPQTSDVVASFIFEPLLNLVFERKEVIQLWSAPALRLICLNPKLFVMYR